MNRTKTAIFMYDVLGMPIEQIDDMMTQAEGGGHSSAVHIDDNFGSQGIMVACTNPGRSDFRVSVQ